MSNRIFSTGNNFPTPSSNVGGGRHVWYQRGRSIPGGFNIDLPNFPKGSVVQAGSLIKYDEATRKVDLHIAVKVDEVAASGATTVKIAKILEASVLNTGQFLMVAPDGITDAGTGVEVLSIDSSNPAYDVITIPALSAELSEGTILVEADKVGAGAVVKVVPNALSYYDIFVHPDSTQFTVTATIEGTVYERRIPPVADAFKPLFTEITFSQSR